MIYILVCDGSSLGNPGPGGFSYALWETTDMNAKLTAKSSSHTTNNIMELSSIIEGLKEYNMLNISAVYTDSMYAVNGMNKWIYAWKKNKWHTAKKAPVKNFELWVSLDSILSSRKIDLLWMKGHSKSQSSDSIFYKRLVSLQNTVDKYARTAAKKQCGLIYSNVGF